MENLQYKDDKLCILDQRLLPNEEKWIEIKNKEQAFDAIKDLAVRGAPAIGIFAGYCMALFSKNNDIYALKKYLDSSRPTAVNLSWATARIVKAYESGKNLLDEAIAIHKEDIEMCKRISEYGLSLLNDGDTILTHCNAGELATSKYGTGLGPLILGKEKGYNFKVYSDETRPLLQGARLTSYELEKAGIDVTVICDNMSGFVMKKGLINAALVGCDRVAANGVGQKIGSGLGTAAFGGLLTMCGYNGMAEVQTASAVSCIRIIFIVAPIAIYLILIVLAWLFKLDKQFPQIQKELEERKRSKASVN